MRLKQSLLCPKATDFGRQRNISRWAKTRSRHCELALVDVAIDQGGCFETSHATTHSEPTYEVDGVVHYCVANMPGAVPLTSSEALNNSTLPFGLALANKRLSAVRDDRHLRAGLNVHRGRITLKAVAESLGLSFSPLEDRAVA